MNELIAGKMNRFLLECKNIIDLNREESRKHEPAALLKTTIWKSRIKRTAPSVKTGGAVPNTRTKD